MPRPIPLLLDPILDAGGRTAGPAEKVLYYGPRAGGGTMSLCQYRLLTTLLVGREPAAGQPDQRRSCLAMIDTGAAVSIIPKAVWSRFAADHWVALQFADRIEPVRRGQGLTRDRVSVFGRECGYTLRQIDAAVVDLWDFDHQLPAVPLVVMCLEDDFGDVTDAEVNRRAVIGLGRSVLSGRRLWCEPDAADPNYPSWFLADP